MLIGAGFAAQMVIAKLSSRVAAIALWLVDDDPSKVGIRITACL